MLALSVWGCAGSSRLATLELGTEAVSCYTATSHATDVLALDGSDQVLVATSGGLLRYARDGRLLARLTRRDGLAGHTLEELQATPDGAVWIATAQGVSRLEDGLIETYTTRDGLNDVRAHALGVDQAGQLFVGTERGVSRFAGGRFEPFDDTHEFGRRPTYAIHTGPDGALWFAKEHALTQYLGDGRWRVFQRDPVRPGPRSDLPANSVRAVVTDELGHPWIGTARGLGHFDERSWQQVFHNPRHALPGSLRDSRIAALARDAGGSLWVGHGDTEMSDQALGLGRRVGSEWRYLGEEQGLPSGRVHRVRVDAMGGIWVATSRGAAVHERGRFEVFHSPGELASNAVLALAALGDGRMAVLTSAGLGVFDGGRPDVSLGPPPGDPGGIAVAGGELYAAGRSLWRLARDAWVPERSFPGGAPVWVASSGAELWVLSAAGVFRGRAGSWQRQQPFVWSGGAAGARVFAGPGGEAWVSAAGAERNELVGTRAGRLATRELRYQPLLAHVSFDPAGEAWLAGAGGLVHLETGAALGPQDQRDFVARVSVWDARGRAWVGTRQSGLWCYDAGLWTRVVVRGRELPREITSLAFEDAETLWIGTAAEGALRVKLAGEAP